MSACELAKGALVGRRDCYVAVQKVGGGGALCWANLAHKRLVHASAAQSLDGVFLHPLCWVSNRDTSPHFHTDKHIQLGRTCTNLDERLQFAVVALQNCH